MFWKKNWYSLRLELTSDDIAGLEKEELVGTWGLPRWIVEKLARELKYKLNDLGLKVEYPLISTIKAFGYTATLDYPELIRISGENWLGRWCENYYEMWLPKKFHLWLEELRASGPGGLKPIKTRLWYKLSSRTAAERLHFSR